MKLGLLWKSHYGKVSNKARLGVQEAAAEVLAESGVAALEARVLAFLYRHSGALRLLATIDDAAQLLLQARPRFAAASFYTVFSCVRGSACHALSFEERYCKFCATSQILTISHLRQCVTDDVG